MPTPKKILFLHPDPPGFSGQRVAALMTRQAIDTDDRFSCTTIATPGFPKTGNRIIAVPVFVVKSLWAYIYFFLLSFCGRWDGLFVAVSQTQRSIARDQLLVRIFKIRNPRKPVIFRIDSSLFTRWKMDQPTAIKFKKLLSFCDAVSTLGPQQQEILRSEFVGDSVEVVTIPNTCSIDCVSKADISTKHDTDSVPKILHLSSLMEPKGYSHLIDATATIEQKFELTLCGKLTRSAFDTRFGSIDEQKNHLEKVVNQRTNLTWIDGAIGEAKISLFKEAHIFVFPSWYPVEAQPLVLLEAMASGCAIVTSSIGEIPFIVGEEDAIIVDGKNLEQITLAVEELLRSPDRRKQLALRGRKIFLDKFGTYQYEMTWRSLFERHLLNTDPT